MEEKKKFDFKALLTADINDLFKKKTASASKPSKVKKPKLMLKPVVSFDFGNEFIKVVEGRYVNNQLKITNYFMIPTQGFIEDGRVLDVARLSEIIKKSLEENGVKAKHAVCTLNSTQIINRELLVPVVEDEELDTVVRYEIQQFLPVNLADYLIQYVVLEEVEINNQPRLKLNVVTFPEKMASSYYELFKEVGLKPYALDVSYNALGKLANYTQLVKEVTDLEGTVAFVDIGAQSIDLNIFKNRNIQFTRLIKSGGIIINERLNQLPDMSIKSAASLIESANLTDEDPASRVLRLCVDEMMYELERVLQFYRNKSVGNQIDHLFILGGLSHLEGLPTYMSDKLNIPVSLLDELNQVIFEKPANEIYHYINAIGAIIRL